MLAKCATPEFNGAAQSAPPEQWQPITKERHEELKTQLSEPTLILEHTPQGAVLNEIRSENDQKIAAEMAYISSRLERRRNQAVDRFNMAHDGPRGEHLSPRMKM